MTEIQAEDPYSNQILCVNIYTTPVHPNSQSPYGKAIIIFWASVGLAIAYWLIVGIARIISAFGRGVNRGPGLWSKVKVGGYILASAISGERLATSPALMRFCELRSPISFRHLLISHARYTFYARHYISHPMVLSGGHDRRRVADFYMSVSFRYTLDFIV
jgi:hypothetical protein